MTVSEAIGDLFDESTWTIAPGMGEGSPNSVDVLGHGVNCMGAMGAGIAVQFKNRYPVMHLNYMEMCEKGWLLPGQVFPWFENADTPLVLNIASQYLPGRSASMLYLEAGLLYAKFYMGQTGRQHLALPRIGAGIGGLKYDDVLECVNSIFGESTYIHVTMVSLEDA